MTAELHLVDDPADGGLSSGTTRHDVVLEQAILGALLTNAAVRDEVLETGLTGKDFYRPVHEDVWDAIEALAERREPIDPTTVAAELTARGVFAKVGGYAYLHTLTAASTSPWAAVKHAERVHADAVLRRLTASGTKVQQIGSTFVREDVDEALEAAQAAVAEVADTRHTGTGDDDLSAAIDETITELEEGTSPALSTGFEDLDRLLNGGLRPKTVTAIGARPGVGKTVVGLQVALHVAVTLGEPVGYTTLEMDRRDLLLRAYANLGSLNYARLLKSPGKTPDEKLTDAEWRAVARAAEQVRGSRLVIPDRSYASVASIRADIRRVQRRHGSCALWVVDYLQLVTPADTRVVREQQVAGIMRGLKQTALALGTPLVLLAQLSRDGEKSGRPPVITDLRESGSVEQDSDSVVLLHRVIDTGDGIPQPATPGQPTLKQPAPGPDVLGVLVPKNRRGATGGFAMTFEGHHQRIVPKPWRAGDAGSR